MSDAPERLAAALAVRCRLGGRETPRDVPWSRPEPVGMERIRRIDGT